MNDEAEARAGQRVGAILWAGKYIILASVIIMIALAFLYTSSESKVYQATAILQVTVATNQPASSDTTSTNQALAQNYATLLVSPGLLSTIRSGVEGGKLSTATLQSRLTATALPSSSLVQLQATGPSPAAAEQLARQVSEGFLNQLRRSAATNTTALQSQDETTLSNISAQIAKLQAEPKTPSTSQQIASLQSSQQALITQNEALVASGLAQGTSATLAGPPVASNDPISPKRSLNLLGGLILGLVLGIALAWIRHLLRPEIQSAEEAASEAGWRVLASIPLKPKLRSEDPSVIESYRILSTRLSIAMREREQRVVAVTGFGPQVGKTSTVKGLGEALAERGNRVLMVDGDMRAASLSTVYGFERRAGLVDVLQGAVAAEPAVVQVEGTLYVLPTRQSKINAARLLSRHETEVMMADLRANFDYILIDTPPIAALADGLILASLSDLVVFVVRAGLTRPRDLRAAAASLSQSNTPVEGMVVFEQVETDLYYPMAGNGKPKSGVTEPRRLTPTS